LSKYTTVIFDLDGTLLNTLEDLKNSVNYALRTHHMPERTLEEVRRFVGNGVERLMELAVPEGKANPDFHDTYADFKAHYLIHCNDTTGPYPHIMDLLKTLKEQNYKLAIVSNKYINATQELNRMYFSSYVDVAIGEKTGIRKKPAPDTVLEAMRELGSDRQECIYVGDSDVDVATARNTGIPCISVSWGFRTHEELLASGATLFVKDPMEIPELLKQ
jgi:phosphoglycolate phosphatase